MLALAKLTLAKLADKRLGDAEIDPPGQVGGQLAVQHFRVGILSRAAEDILRELGLAGLLDELVEENGLELLGGLAKIRIRIRRRKARPCRPRFVLIR